MTNTLFFKRAIEDYIIGVLQGLSGLDDISVFIRGVLMPEMVRLDYFPYGEVWIPEDDEYAPLPESTGGYYDNLYTGFITVNVEMTTLAGGDWLDVTEDRLLTLPSYDLVEEYMYYIMSELQKCDHKSLGDLSLNDEVAGEFTVVGPRIYGYDRHERLDTWTNFGLVPFQVTSLRTR